MLDMTGGAIRVPVGVSKLKLAAKNNSCIAMPSLKKQARNLERAIQ
jgi:hypothetical protein